MSKFLKLKREQPERLPEWNAILSDHLITIRDACEKHSVKYWLYWGTLLGFRREKEFLEFDGDIDIAIDPTTITLEFLNEIKPCFIHYSKSGFSFKFDEIYSAIDQGLTTELRSFQISKRDKTLLNRCATVDCVILYPFNEKHTVSKYSKTWYSFTKTYHTKNALIDLNTKYGVFKAPEKIDNYLCEVFGETWNIKNDSFNGLHDKDTKSDNFCKISNFGELRYDWSKNEVIKM